MSLVFLHLYAAKNAEPENSTAEISRVPLTGELLALPDQRHFTVTQVIHCIGREFAAEVWGHQLGEKDVAKALKQGAWRGPKPVVG